MMTTMMMMLQTVSWECPKTGPWAAVVHPLPHTTVERGNFISKTETGRRPSRATKTTSKSATAWTLPSKAKMVSTTNKSQNVLVLVCNIPSRKSRNPRNSNNNTDNQSILFFVGPSFIPPPPPPPPPPPVPPFFTISYLPSS